LPTSICLNLRLARAETAGMTATSIRSDVPVTDRSRGAPEWLPLLAAGVTMLLWASAFIAIRAVGEHYSPGAMALGRLTVGGLALTAVAALRPVTRPRGRTLGLVVAYGALWFGLYTLSL